MENWEWFEGYRSSTRLGAAVTKDSSKVVPIKVDESVADVDVTVLGDSSLLANGVELLDGGNDVVAAGDDSTDTDVDGCGDCVAADVDCELVTVALEVDGELDGCVVVTVVPVDELEGVIVTTVVSAEELDSVTLAVVVSAGELAVLVVVADSEEAPTDVTSPDPSFVVSPRSAVVILLVDAAR